MGSLSLMAKRVSGLVIDKDLLLGASFHAWVSWRSQTDRSATVPPMLGPVISSLLLPPHRDTLMGSGRR